MNQQGNKAPNGLDPQWTILKLLTWTTSYFETHHIDQARTDAEILLAHLLGLRRIDLYVQYDKPLTQEELARFRSMVKRRSQREPVAYILGVKEFWSMDLEVGPGVLIPRPETECLVEAALEKLTGCGDHPRVLELGTGTGAISLALAREIKGPQKDLQVVASDRSIRAIILAQKNAKRHQLLQKVAFICGDWFAPLSKEMTGFDLIISNPPYVPSRDINTLQPEVSQFEPAEALDGGGLGLDCIAHIIHTAPDFLKPGGWVMLEIGWDQWPEICKIVDAAEHYDDMAVRQDYSGHDRIVQLHKKPL